MPAGLAGPPIQSRNRLFNEAPPWKSALVQRQLSRTLYVVAHSSVFLQQDRIALGGLHAIAASPIYWQQSYEINSATYPHRSHR